MFRSRHATRETRNSPPTLNFGFSLIEILITLTLVGLLSAIAFPTYSHYTKDAHRLAAVLALEKIASLLETYYLLHDTYQQATLELLNAPVVTAYDFRLTNLTDSTYVIEAIPLAEDPCGILSLNAAGEKMSRSGEVSACWG